MKQHAIYLMTIFMLVLSAACVTVPALDTPEKQLAAAEISWKHTLMTVDKNVDRMSAAQRAEVSERLLQGKEALDAARLAVRLADGSIDFSNKISTVNTSLGVVRSLLEELEKREQKQ